MAGSEAATALFPAPGINVACSIGMRTSTLTETMALGAISGMRTFSGPAALTFGHRLGLRRAAAALAIAEMVADKLPSVPDRIAPFPLTARATSGAVVGGVIAREEGRNVWAGALLGAAAAVAAAYAAYHLRRRSPLPNALNGMLEDAVVFGVVSYFASAER
jgi:uncharacterized membrane protein